LSSRIYKGGQGPPQNIINTQDNTNHQTGRRVLRTSRPEPMYTSCCLHLQVPDLGDTLSKSHHLGYTPRWQAVKHRHWPCSAVATQPHRLTHYWCSKTIFPLGTLVFIVQIVQCDHLKGNYETQRSSTTAMHDMRKYHIIRRCKMESML
jgi:hypothetical protein